MPKNASKYYWWCQIGGWVFMALIIIVLSSTSFEQKLTDKFIYNTLIVVMAGFFSTHLFREVIRYSKMLSRPFEKLVPRFAIGILLTCLLGSLVRIYLG